MENKVKSFRVNHRWYGNYELIDCETGEVFDTVDNRSDIAEKYPDFKKCANCNVYYPKDQFRTVEGLDVCEHCYEEAVIKCNGCGEEVFRNNTVKTRDTEHRFCYYCKSKLYSCAVCGSLFELPILTDEDTGRLYCKGCNPDDINVVDYYHTMKDSNHYTFHTDAPRDQKVCMGFELEVSSDNEDSCSRTPYAKHVMKIFKDFFHFEEDCSIGDGGFEMISQPASLDYLLSRANDFKEAWSYLTRNGYTSHDNERCGFHIHVDRQFFGKNEDSCIAKIIFLMMKYREEFRIFSRRRNSQLSDWCTMFDKDNENITLLVKEGRDGNRYRALNLTNKNTIEFRIWRGTLNYATFIATLKFTDRICNLVKDTGIAKLNQMTWEEILGDDEDIKAYWNVRTARRAAAGL